MDSSKTSKNEAKHSKTFELKSQAAVLNRILHTSSITFFTISALVVYNSFTAIQRCGSGDDRTPVLIFLCGTLSLLLVPWLLLTLPIEKCDNHQRQRKTPRRLRNILLIVSLCLNCVLFVVIVVNIRSWWRRCGGCAGLVVYMVGLFYVGFYWLMVVGCVVVRRLLWFHLLGYVLFSYLPRMKTFFAFK